MGTLFIVSTPIGNLEDITIRAIKTLFTVDSVLCEDTRRTGMLLKLLKEKYSNFVATVSIKSEGRQYLLSYYEQNEMQRIPQVITALKNGLSVALVSDAGTPAISDPGFKLVRECLSLGIKVESVPGPSSVISSLVVSGLPTDKFIFVGYPPKKPGHRKTFLQNIKLSQDNLSVTVIMFESPHKLKTTLSDMLEAFGDSEIVLARELTKIHEERLAGKISFFIDYYKKTVPKGEYVVLFNVSNP